MRQAALDVMDAIGSGHQLAREIAEATRLPLPQVYARLHELKRGGIVQASRNVRRTTCRHRRGERQKVYRLNPWSAKP